MITDKLPNLIGYKYHPLDVDDRFVFIETPYFFEDGRIAPIYANMVDPYHIQFDDDGDVVTHFEARCLMYNHQQPIISAIDTFAQKHSITFAGRQVLEICGPVEDAQKLFADFLETMIDIKNWELEFLQSLGLKRRHSKNDLPFSHSNLTYNKKWHPHQVPFFVSSE